ncbi:hypothetical protein C8J57DRAFT_1714881 [Mycena rebaudengoi]|nr:hypothetical protein C8J57DRAFT_1714881 [Mycena rebaudengoi]
MLHILHFLIATASTVNAAVLTPRITYAWSITDFQGNMLDLADGNASLFTPVQSFTPTNTTNQQWAVISSQDARQVYELVNVASNTVMTHTTALLTPPGPALHTQIIGGDLTTFWKLESAGNFTRFLDEKSGLALTAWPIANGSGSSPLTLETSNSNNQGQLFIMKCIKGWSFPDSPC